MKRFFLAILVLLLSLSVFGHEYWFEPDKFFLAPNESTAVHLFVGEALNHDEERVFQLSKTTMFQLFSVRNRFDLMADIKEGALPIYNLSAEKPGNYLLALERNGSYIQLGAKEFEDYLREDGMEYIIAEREKLDERQKEGRERYSRFIKTMLQIGDKHDAVFKKNAGLKLEIIPLENPYSKKVGDDLKFQVLFDGKPLNDKTVFADNKDGGVISHQKLKTDRSGQVSVKLDGRGVWLVRLVFMQRCASRCAEADWESFWGAFSFGVK